MDHTAIKEITNQSSAKDFNERNELHELAVVPKDHESFDVAKHNGIRRVFKAIFKTDSLTDFVEYTNKHQWDDSELFIDKQSMMAVTIFDLMRKVRPGTAEHRAEFTAAKTPEYASILKLTGAKMSQKDLAEFGEEWGDVFTFIDSNGEPIELIKAINAIRNMKINASSSSESSVGDLAASKSRTAQIEAKGREVTVAGLTGTNIPIFNDLGGRDIKVKFSILTNGDDIALTARLLNKDRMLESLANELSEKIASQAEITTYLGSIKV